LYRCVAEMEDEIRADAAETMVGLHKLNPVDP
jgi:hypothetical protein